MKRKRKENIRERRSGVGNKEKSKVRWKKKWGGKELRKRWVEWDSVQSHRLFTALMFNYF